RTTEKSKSVYMQYDTHWEGRVPVSLSLGLRYEKTDVVSTAQVVTPKEVQWVADNELFTVSGDKAFTTLSGSYQYWLPSLDTKCDLTDDMVLRASYGHSIGRPGWNDLKGGQSVATLVRVNGGSGSSGNPALKPLLSKNFDLSWEWYYGDASYFSVTYYRKN